MNWHKPAISSAGLGFPSGTKPFCWQVSTTIPSFSADWYTTWCECVSAPIIFTSATSSREQATSERQLVKGSRSSKDCGVIPPGLRCPLTWSTPGGGKIPLTPITSSAIQTIKLSRAIMKGTLQPGGTAGVQAHRSCSGSALKDKLIEPVKVVCRFT